MSDPAAADERRPRWVYRDGTEPDYRFSMANERTFLAWLRTGLALLAGGVAVDSLAVGLDDWLQRVVATVLVILGLGCVAAAWWRWALSERAMRRKQPLPGGYLMAALSGAIVLVGVVVAVFSLW